MEISNILYKMKEASIISLDYDTLSSTYNNLKSRLDPIIKNMKTIYTQDQELMKVLNSEGLNSNSQKIKKSIFNGAKTLGNSALSLGTSLLGNTSNDDKGEDEKNEEEGIPSGLGNLIGGFVSQSPNIISGNQSSSDVISNMMNNTGVSRFSSLLGV